MFQFLITLNQPITQLIARAEVIEIYPTETIPKARVTLRLYSSLEAMAAGQAESTRSREFELASEGFAPFLAQAGALLKAALETDYPGATAQDIPQPEGGQ